MGFIISVVLAIIIVNLLFKVFCSILGGGILITSVRTKLIAYFVAFVILFSIIG